MAVVEGNRRQRLSRIGRGAIAFGVVALFVATCLGFAGDAHWYLDQFSHFRPQYVIWFALTLPVVIWWRRWVVAVLGVAGLGWNLAVMLPHAIAINKPLPAAAPIRVVSFNLLQGNKTLGAVEQFIRDSNADVLVFQEVTPESAEVLRKLDPIYPGQHIRGRKHSKGTALLTRLPVKSTRFEATPGQELIGAVIGELDGPGGAFTVFGIHSHKPTSAKGAASQDSYFDWLAAQVAAERSKGRAVIVAGDFNATPWSRGFKRFTAACPLLDTSRGVLFGATWSYYLPYRLLIDHAFVSDEWLLRRREVGPALGSDHRPLILDLARFR
jgi:endonuclease/exonuclease/phosphatase (EEP) superfamily protein YafD